ncbi:hypothetical protein CEXT_160781 [Caerostris extrusa]|uniref:Uncharacterized protein n=1 Tax=Caerostris extrusa TaxID=172846 RepID=A0AAV4XS33_CAEEX|nr:hypothetical protein CEXT_160781 [Caerostris extrusa]
MKENVGEIWNAVCVCFDCCLRSKELPVKHKKGIVMSWAGCMDAGRQFRIGLWETIYANSGTCYTPSEKSIPDKALAEI